MTREEFDGLPSDRSRPCPDCGQYATHPTPGCPCRQSGDGFTHINKHHHTCPKRAPLETAEVATARIVKAIAGQVPVGWGVVVVLSSIGPHGFTTYVSSLEREGALRMLKEMMAHMEKTV